tara:strand:+ start:67 stop:228 length:162 start_codon:yes stop_codon:yes gene_type:complete
VYFVLEGFSNLRLPGSSKGLWLNVGDRKNYSEFGNNSKKELNVFNYGDIYEKS